MFNIAYVHTAGWRAREMDTGNETKTFDLAFAALEACAELCNTTIEHALTDTSLVELGWILEPFHDGKAIYAVVSTLVQGKANTAENTYNAIRALRRTKQDAKHPEAVTDEDVRMNNVLANELERRFKSIVATYAEHEQTVATQMTWVAVQKMDDTTEEN
jgi:hypothetical protein